VIIVFQLFVQAISLLLFFFICRCASVNMPFHRWHLLHQGDGVEPVGLVFAAVQAGVGQEGFPDFDFSQNKNG
jgi:hypothetical protein